MKFLAPFLLSLAVTACDSPSGATCPPANAPTYQAFADQFFTSYCRDCHSQNAVNRHGAPGSQNYDTEEQIQAHADDIDVEAAAGPNATNTSMPDLGGPVKMAPTQAEREMLGQYLACLKAQ